MYRSTRLIALFAASLASAPAHVGDALGRALRDSAVPIRTLDARDEDFADLEPIAHAIGDSRVVLLGEPSHGAGGALEAKARLVRFLHQRMGFSVLAWESGLHGMQTTANALAAGEAPHDAARRGIFPIWSAARQLQPLFEYVAGSRGHVLPIAMAGFDPQFTAPGAVEYFEADLRDFLSKIDDDRIRQESLGQFERMMAALARLRARPQPPESTVPVEEADRDHVVDSVARLLATLRSRPLALTRAHDSMRISFVERSLESVRDEAINTHARRRPDRPTDARRLPLQSAEWNRRDERMAANLRWLIDERHRGRKIIVWGHNAHLMRAHFAMDWQAVAHEPSPDGMTPMGALISGDPGVAGGIYAIGFTTFDGEDRWANGQKHDTIAPAPPGSLEARLHDLGHPYLFLDLRAASRQLGGNPVGPLSMRISGYGPPTAPYGHDRVPDLARAYDAVVFIDRMTPAVALAGR